MLQWIFPAFFGGSRHFAYIQVLSQDNTPPEHSQLKSWQTELATLGFLNCFFSFSINYAQTKVINVFTVCHTLMTPPPPPQPPVFYSMLSRKHVDITRIFEHDKGKRSRGLLGVRRRRRERGVCPDQFGPDFTHNKHEAILVKTFMFKMYPERGRYAKKKTFTSKPWINCVLNFINEATKIQNSVTTCILQWRVGMYKHGNKWKRVAIAITLLGVCHFSIPQTLINSFFSYDNLWLQITST